MPVAKRLKTFVGAVGLVIIGLIFGAFLFSGVQPRSFLTIHKCENRCLNPSELLGLVGSVIVQKMPQVLPSVILETEKTIVIKHPFPAATIHYIILPKKDIKDAGDISAEDQAYLIDAYAVMLHLIEENSLTNYRIVTNGPGLQQVRYLHFHLLEDRPKS